MDQLCDAQIIRHEIHIPLSKWPNELSHLVRQYAVSAGQLLEEHVKLYHEHHNHSSIYFRPPFEIYVMQLASHNITSLYFYNWPNVEFIEDIYSEENLLDGLRTVSDDIPKGIILDIIKKMYEDDRH